MNLSRATLSELRRAMARGEVSSEELTRGYLDRIERCNGGLNAYLDVYAESAIAEARERDRERAGGETRGALHGVPIALKDIIDIEGRVTTAGGILLPERPAERDAEVTRRLRASGAVLLGKLNLHEFAWGGTTRNTHFGNSFNPWKKGYSPGGSSGGSGAAVAAGLAAGTLGTDTLGSVRIPSSYCGCVGLKTTYGLVSNRGVYPLAWSLDTVGPIVRCTEDAWTVLEVIVSPDLEDPVSRLVGFGEIEWDPEPSLEGRRIGLVKNDALAHDGSAEEIETIGIVGRAVRELEKLGAEIEEIELPEWNEARSVVMKIGLVEASAVHEKHLKEHPESIGEDVRQRLELGMNFSGLEVARCYQRKREITQRVTVAVEDFDALVFPTTATASHAFDPKLALKTAKYTSPVNLLGWPAVSVPCGFNAEGMPVGLQIVTRPIRDWVALRIARAYEAATDWSSRVPPEFED